MAAGPVLSVLAHQGGWDEILLVAGPLVVIALFLRVANRRVKDELAEQAASPVEPAEHPGE